MPVRVATYAAPLSRDGPGLLLRDITKGEDAQIAATRAVIAETAPDILVLTNFDYDLDGYALSAFAALFGDAYPHQFAGRPNTGMPTGLDLDKNGRLGEPRDAQGYGRFSGDGGLAILSRYPIGAVTDHSALLWRDLPGAVWPEGFYTAEDLAVQRLSSTAHWIVPIDLPTGRLHLMAYAATPPVFDGPEDRNGLRNRDELRLWEAVLDGKLGPVPEHFVIAGNANLDPLGGAGKSAAMAAFLADPRLQDPLPGRPTADWDDDGPGDLRVSYVLPARSWRVLAADVHWPEGSDGAALAEAGPHHLVWVDLLRQP